MDAPSIHAYASTQQWKHSVFHCCRRSASCHQVRSSSAQKVESPDAKNHKTPAVKPHTYPKTTKPEQVRTSPHPILFFLSLTLLSSAIESDIAVLSLALILGYLIIPHSNAVLVWQCKQKSVSPAPKRGAKKNQRTQIQAVPVVRPSPPPDPPPDRYKYHCFEIEAKSKALFHIFAEYYLSDL